MQLETVIVLGVGFLLLIVSAFILLSNPSSGSMDLTDSAEPAKEPSQPLKPVEPEEKEQQHRKHRQLMSPAEQRFFNALREVAGEHYWLLTKVRLADLVKPKSGMQRAEWRTAFNKIKAKSVDFVLC